MPQTETRRDCSRVHQHVSLARPRVLLSSTSPLPVAFGRVQPWYVGMVLGVVAAAGACAESSSSISTGPSPAKCEVSLTAPSALPPGGGSGAISVATQPECVWNVTSQLAWISGLSPTSGQGSGRVQFTAAANPQPAAREGELQVNDGRVRVTQQAAPASCQYELSQSSGTVDAAGGAGNSVAITSAPACAWTASSAVPWITITSGASGTGNGSVSFNVAANVGQSRTGSLTVANQPFLVTQAGLTPSQCAYAISPASQTIGATGGVGSPITVTVASGCAWTASSAVPWITLLSGNTGSGNGVVTFTAAVNTGPERVGTLSVAGQTFSLTQSASSCAFAISPSSAAVSGAGATGQAVAVTTTAACTWSATSNAPWITIASGASGTGTGSVTFNVSANTGAQRSGTLTVAGQTFTVTQDVAPCLYTLNPTSAAPSAGGGAGAPVSVSTSAGCTWTATSNDPWLTVNAGSSGTGNGSVTYFVGIHTSLQARTGSLTIAGQTFTVNQAGCVFSLSPTGASLSNVAGTYQVQVSTTPGCSWTALTNQPWLSVVSGASGSGNGTVQYSVTRNDRGSDVARTGTLTIAGRVFIVDQAGR